MLKHFLFLIVICFFSTSMWSQYEFSGYTSDTYKEGSVYLSIVEDYRKISGVHPEQILDKTKADSTGFFVFKGNKLSEENKIYRIHVDKCNEQEQQTNHFTGHCSNSKEIVFVANNTTRLSLPFTFEDEMFCSIISENKNTAAFLKIDSLKNDMKYAFASYRSEANRKLNSKKWFGVLQQYGAQLEEPLAELYSYSFLSERGSDLHSYYLENLAGNEYYDSLLERLEKKYPNSPYTRQYEAELKSDNVLLGHDTGSNASMWLKICVPVLLLSFFINVYFLLKQKRSNSIVGKKQTLSKQEQKVLELILEDKTNKEIAAEIFVSVSTVKTHINNLYKKMGVSSREEVKKM